jgi:hypothetical protein
MPIVSKIYRLYSSKRLKLLDQNRKDPISFQRVAFENFLTKGEQTIFGAEHNIHEGMSLQEFQESVPLRDYNKIESWITRSRAGEENLLWPGRTKWFAKSSGTSSSKSKFIPVTEDSLNLCHYDGMQNMLSTYLDNNPGSKLLEGMALTLGGSAKIDEEGNGKTQYGDLSAILLKNSPILAEFRRTPPTEVALISDFETKVGEICKVTSKQNVTSLSGVPSWNLILLNAILEFNGKKDLREVWPNLELFMHGGISFEPYKKEYKRIIPHNSMNYMENYNASEGYFAFQDDPGDNSMLLMTNGGIFYEFIPIERYEDAIEGKFTSFETVESVKVGVNYAMVITTNGGLWRYLIGDSVMFTSLFPHKITITGRTQLFINAFGEELMISNAEKALTAACEELDCSVENFTVAPLFMEGKGKGSHQWLIEFKDAPSDIEEFAETLDKEVCKVNSDYEAKRANSITMTRLSLVPLPSGTFYNWLRDNGKLGGQNKVPRLSNGRKFVEELLEYTKR